MFLWWHTKVTKCLLNCTHGLSANPLSLSIRRRQGCDSLFKLELETSTVGTGWLLLGWRCYRKRTLVSLPLKLTLELLCLQKSCYQVQEQIPAWLTEGSASCAFILTVPRVPCLQLFCSHVRGKHAGTNLKWLKESEEASYSFNVMWLWEKKKIAVSSDHHYTADCTSTSCISRCNACVGTYSWEAGELTAELTFLPCEDWLGQLSWRVCALASSTWGAEPTWKCWWSWVMGTTVVGFLWPVYIFLRLFSDIWAERCTC